MNPNRGSSTGGIDKRHALLAQAFGRGRCNMIGYLPLRGLVVPVGTCSRRHI